MKNLGELISLENRLRNLIQKTPDKRIYTQRMDFLRKKYAQVQKDISEWTEPVHDKKISVRDYDIY